MTTSSERGQHIPTLHLICGLPCSGKTTLARKLELDAIRNPIETMLSDHALRLLTFGVDAALDFSVWTRGEREGARARAAAVGARTELHFTDAPDDVLLARLAERNADLPPGTFWIDPAWLRDWFPLFQRPTPDELQPRDPPVKRSKT